MSPLVPYALARRRPFSVDMFQLVTLIALGASVYGAVVPDLGDTQRVFDVQAHRGDRGNTIENTIPAFAQALIDGATTLELDNAVTKDGVPVVWHDERIDATKCLDTRPVEEEDPMFPYVGKNIANLTLAQVKTLDCGSQRLSAFPLQVLYPGARISSMKEVFDFVGCVDKSRKMQWNIESKVNPLLANATLPYEEFVRAQYDAFTASSYPPQSITFQSFDWATLEFMKSLDSKILRSALADASTTRGANGVYPWLGGVSLDDFNGTTHGERVAQAAASLNVQVLSPGAAAHAEPGPYFTTQAMVTQAHRLGLLVKPWTVNNLTVASDLIEYGVDGIISDYSDHLRRMIQLQGQRVSQRYPKKRVNACLEEHAASWKSSGAELA
ncbi:PLC-like phosphodiesterase [Pterulicium gracile]|uniref:PLC-like phosphodiesterase n=1 Tax=Pterulicium gracile TaxID=1884261 RepID=A0A5C3QWF1_9AGAR|nr:PLC-like phosphodiesterase [Pterula gracilis]